MRLLRNSDNQMCIASHSLYPIIDTKYKPSGSALGVKTNAVKISVKLHNLILINFLIAFVF